MLNIPPTIRPSCSYDEHGRLRAHLYRQPHDVMLRQLVLIFQETVR